MITGSSAFERFVILADESAAWEIAGLPQLDRIVLSLNEFAESSGPETTIDAVIFWKPELPSTTRWLPRHSKIRRVQLTESVKSLQPSARVISTRVFLDRHGLVEFLKATRLAKVDDVIAEASNSWNELNGRFEASCRAASRPTTASGWQYLESAADGRACEKRILRGSGKSQDGPISKLINRPISRSVTRVLLKYNIDPTVWTMSIFVLPLAAFFFLLRGDYIAVVVGAGIFQLYSILDGCDGEIARAKYLESERGGRIDDLLDMLGSVLFVTGLGFGLFRSRSSLYLLEGVLCAGVIVANEWLLRFSQSAAASISTTFTQALYPRHRRLARDWPLSLLNEKFAWWLIQFTKRDVAIFIFLLLAIADRPQWILHLWIAVSAVTLTLSGRMHFTRRVGPDSDS